MFQCIIPVQHFSQPFSASNQTDLEADTPPFFFFKNSPRAHKSSSEGTVHSSPNNDKSRNANSARKVPSEVRRDHLESTDVSMAESEDFLSPRYSCFENPLRSTENLWDLLASGGMS